MTRYTLGFLFHDSFQEVLLIRKNKPNWQAGKLNGIGGHIDHDETAVDCMNREFKEEVAYDGPPFIWKEFALLNGSDFQVYCFCATGFPIMAQPKTDEQTEVFQVFLVGQSNEDKDMVENLPWLIYAAIDFLQDGRPKYISVEYP